MRAIKLLGERAAVTLYIEDAPVTRSKERSPHSQVRDFLAWWRKELARHRISCPYDATEPRLARRLLAEYGQDRLRALAKEFVLKYGSEMRRPEERRRLLLLGQKRKEVEADLKEMGLWQQNRA